MKIFRSIAVLCCVIIGLALSGKVYAADISVEGTGSSASVKVTGVPEGTVPVFFIWTEAGGQDDIKQANGVLQPDGSYTYVLNSADHRNEAGTYKIHVYIMNGGTLSMIGSATAELEGAVVPLSSVTAVPVMQQPIDPKLITVPASKTPFPADAVIDPLNPFAEACAIMDYKVSLLGSATGCVVAVDKYSNIARVYVYDGSKYNCVLSNLCTTGKNHSTPSGIYSIGTKGYSFGTSDYTCYYYSGFIRGDYLFHSVLYRPGTFKIKDGRLGRCLSHGCIRLDINDAKFIHDYVPVGSTVLVY